ncbi:MAG: DUF3267 domain-containing protein [Ruminococcus sp.]|nr:DUF3267 domain-containing protein [Ruminococcus sp.]
MKLHYCGKYDLNPDSLPHGEHKENAHKFKEVNSTKQLAIIANIGCIIIMILLAIPALIRCWDYIGGWSLPLGCVASVLVLFPHEFLHAICFKEDVYLYTNLKQGLIFVVGTETMSKSRFIFMSLLPNIVFGAIPYIIGMIFPSLIFFTALGVISIGMGFGDYYNVFNALTQMPKGSRTYLYGLNSWWYMPQ